MVYVISAVIKHPFILLQAKAILILLFAFASYVVFCVQQSVFSFMFLCSRIQSVKVRTLEILVEQENLCVTIFLHLPKTDCMLC